MSTIDKETFNKIKDRMKAKFPILLDGYIRDAKTYLAVIGTNIPDGNVGDIIEAAHSLKSASGLLGIVQVYKNAEKLEYAAKELQEKGEGPLFTLNTLYVELQNMFSEVEGDLRSELTKAKAS